MGEKVPKILWKNPKELFGQLNILITYFSIIDYFLEENNFWHSQNKVILINEYF